ncbi:phage tail tape measure protein [Salmonella enterica]|nr:phage tail tape measure protein [Salmonella enterica]
MAQGESVGDLVINLSADDAQFQERAAWVKKRLREIGESEDSTGEKVRQMSARQSAALKSLLESIDPAIRKTNQLDRQYAELVDHLNAGRLTQSQFSHFSGMLDDARRGMDSLGESTKSTTIVAEKALTGQARLAQRAGISVGQYTAAMRMLPAQMTDVATQLAGGQSPWLILLQQGGQVKDSFGGLRETITALGGVLSPLRLLVGGAAAGLATLAMTAMQADEENRSLYRALVMTGGASADASTKLWKLADDISIHTKTGTASAVDTLARLASTGRYTATQLQLVAETSQQWTHVMGDGADKIESAFSEIGKSPVQALASLNQQYNFLSVAQLKNIAHLEATKGKQAAVTAAMILFADTMKSRMQQVAGAATPVEGMWDNVKKWTKDAWSWVGEHTLGALNLITDVVAGTVEQVQLLLKQGDMLIAKFADSAYENTKKIPGMRLLFGDLSSDNKKFIAQTESEITALQKSIAERDAHIRQGEMGYVERVRSRRVETGPGQQDAVSDAAKKIEEARRKKDQPGANAGERAMDSAQADLMALRAQLKVLQQHAGMNDTISQQRKELWATEAKFQVLEESALHRKLSAQEKSLLSSKAQVLQLARQKALIGDQIAHQEHLNKLTDSMSALRARLLTRIAADKRNQSLSTRERQRLAERTQLEMDFTRGGGDKNDLTSKATQDYLRNLDLIDEKYRTLSASQEDWLAGASHSLQDWCDNASSLSQQAGQVMTQSLSGAVTGITDVLNGNKSSWRSWSVMVLKMIEKIIVQLMVARALKAAVDGMAGSSMKWMSSLGASLGGASAGSTSVLSGAASGMVASAPVVLALTGNSAAQSASSVVNSRAQQTVSSVAGSVKGVTLSPVFHFEVQADPKTGSGLTPQSAKALGTFVENKVLDVIHRNQRPGGALAGGQI